MSDIVERLRNWRTNAGARGPLQRQAADEITRLRAERDELVEALMVIAAASRIEVQGVPRCEWCGSKAHTDDCPVGIARAVLEKVAP